MFFADRLSAFFCFLQHSENSFHDFRLPFKNAVPMPPQQHRSVWNSQPAKPASTQYALSRRFLMTDFVIFIVVVCPYRTYDFARILIIFNKATFSSKFFPIFQCVEYKPFIPFCFLL